MVRLEVFTGQQKYPYFGIKLDSSVLLEAQVTAPGRVTLSSETSSVLGVPEALDSRRDIPP